MSRSGRGDGFFETFFLDGKVTRGMEVESGIQSREILFWN